MPYVITKKDGKNSGGLGRFVFTAEEIDRLRGDGHTYVVVNIATRRAERIGSTPRKSGRKVRANPRKASKMSLANRKAAARRIAKMPRDSKGKLKPKRGTRANKGRKTARKTTRRKSSRRR